MCLEKIQFVDMCLRLFCVSKFFCYFEISWRYVLIRGRSRMRKISSSQEYTVALFTMTTPHWVNDVELNLTHMKKGSLKILPIS